MNTKLWYAIPLLAMLGTAHAADDEVSPQMLAQFQADCAADAAKSGLSADEREVMNWICVSNLRDYDNSISND